MEIRYSSLELTSDRTMKREKNLVYTKFETCSRNEIYISCCIFCFSANGLKFAFDVKTTLNISDIAFYPSQTTHSYDIYASSTDKEDILFLDLTTGKSFLTLPVVRVRFPKLSYCLPDKLHHSSLRGREIHESTNYLRIKLRETRNYTVSLCVSMRSQVKWK